MRVHVVPCGPAANDSELRAINHLKSGLIGLPGKEEWLLLTNLMFSSSHRRQSDEIDIVAIGPPGVQVIEVKHWTTTWVNKNERLVTQEADRLTIKARRVGTALRRQLRGLPRVDGVFLVTQDASRVRPLDGRQVRGVKFCTLKSWPDALGAHGRRLLSAAQIKKLGSILSPDADVAISGLLGRPIGDYTDLRLCTPESERFHRLYRGIHRNRRHEVILHLYDLSASDERNPEEIAWAQFDALHGLQIFPWAPRIYDSIQEAPGFPGEMWFFTVVDPAAPGIGDRARDDSWTPEARIDYTRRALKALQELHESGGQDTPVFHGNITPSTLLVKHDNTPILTGFQRSQDIAYSNVAVTNYAEVRDTDRIAPEVTAEDGGAPDARSDLYSICASLSVLFDGREDQASRDALGVLAAGMAEQPGDRTPLEELAGLLPDESKHAPQAPLPIAPARYWSEDQIVPFRGRKYRIVSRLGSGGSGKTFKVVEIDQSGGDLGAYVAKVVSDEVIGKRVLRAYRLARSHLVRSTALSTVFETAERWSNNGFLALMAWIEGQPLSDFSGVLKLLAEDLDEESEETLVVRWLRTTCEALDVLHRNGLVHGDVSPANLIISGSEIFLTDYDCVSRSGHLVSEPGTVMYSSGSESNGHSAKPSDDFFALAASFFHVLFDKKPFSYGDRLIKERGLNWKDIERGRYIDLADFFDRATNPDATSRFLSAADASAVLESCSITGEEEERTDERVATHERTVKLSDSEVIRSENEVPWLRFLLQSYPGSRWGNRETRGLDSDFATDTYVTTRLEQSLLDQVRERRVRLIVLCGNAGDGKTALLQHIATSLDINRSTSATRIIEGETEDGMKVRMNLDGSASWEGRSADELLDEFLAPFQQGAPIEDVAHFLAINDGRLLEWIEQVEKRKGHSTPLTKNLGRLLQRGERQSSGTEHIRFISLNERSLVGSVATDHIDTSFLSELLDKLYGGDNAKQVWEPCSTCSAEARCQVRRAMRVFGPKVLAGQTEDEQRDTARQRLFEALQAVHLRGETHVTVRELRAALVYILFGTSFCSEYHVDGGKGDLQVSYWDRAFNPDSPRRQGEVLRELVRFDPALEAHPKVDRYLLRRREPGGSGRGLKVRARLMSLRRKAYFEQSKDLGSIFGGIYEPALARGRHIRDFLHLPLPPDSQRDLCEKLCKGISRLEGLPPQALDRKGVVPLKITPRTPTETAFWVEKELSHFRLEPALPSAVDGLDRLHRHATLVYRYRNDREEKLRFGADLFHVLLELADGYQLGDVSTDDTFTQLSIFVQRIAREDERRVLVWNPIHEDAIYEIAAQIDDCGSGSAVQRVRLNRLGEADG